MANDERPDRGELGESDLPVFRAPKRRKVFRRKDNNDDATQSQGHQLPATAGNTSGDSQMPIVERLEFETPLDGASDEISGVLRQRRAAKTRRGGIGYSNTALQITAAGNGNDAMALIVSGDVNGEEAPNALDAIARRFAPQAGQVTNVADDKIMKNFVDSEIARIQAGITDTNDGALETHDPHSTASTSALNPPGRDPATDGRIQEIDLGPSSSVRNASMTEAATRRLDGNAPSPLDEMPEKVRLGRDGKPRRKRRRRNSEDMKRDEIVEAIMKENKFDMYDEPEVPVQSTGDLAADEQLADEFRREFLEALEARNKQKRPTAPPPGPTGAKSDNPLKGPKLGGSRSARAAMHAREKEKALKK